MKKHPILYSFRRCPYAMRARMAIFLSGQKCELREVLLTDKPEHMVKISPKATVPVLELYDGQVIDESIDIMKWALGENDPHEVLKLYNANINNSNYIIDIIDNKFVEHLNKYKYPDRYENIDPIEHRKICLNVLEEIDRQINKAKYLYGDRLSFLDIAIFPLIRQFRIADQRWFDDKMHLINIKNWLYQLLESNVFLSVMSKIEPWKNGKKPYYFPEKIN